MPIHASNIDQFVEDVKSAGQNLNHPAVGEKYYPFSLTFDTVVDQDLDPFSDAYYENQLELYREISGRSLDQESGELHDIDIAPYFTSPNPTGGYDVSNASEQIRALSTLLALSALGDRPKVLDMGAGGGLSSEVFAYAGCAVHAVDIDPLFGLMSKARAARLGLDITRHVMNYDDLDKLAGTYQAAFFYQSLHHCLKPWELIAELGKKIDDDGVIGFAGEPVQTAWWRNWGLRLDQESVFVARAFGWFESGWSPDFIRDCFRRSRFELVFFSGGLLGSDFGVASRSSDRIARIREQASKIGLRERHLAFTIPDEAFSTVKGFRTELLGRPAMRQGEKSANTPLIFGPYMALDAGRYDVHVVVEAAAEAADGEIVIDACAHTGTQILAREQISASALTGPTLVHLELQVPEKIYDLEIRAFPNVDAGWTLSLPTLRQKG